MKSFKCLGIVFKENEGPQHGVKKRVDEGLKTFDAMKMAFTFSSVSSCAKRVLYDRV